VQHGAVGSAELAAASRKGAAFARLLRPGAIRIPVAVFVAAGLGEAMGGRHVAGGVLLIVGAYGIATILNDLADVEVDRANRRRDRPLATGELSVDDARAALVACGLAVAGSQPLLDQPLGLLVTGAALAVGSAYSGQLAVQRRGLWATALLATAYVAFPVVLAGASPRPGAIAAMLLGAMAALLYKDAKDEAGDRATGKATPLVRHGAAAIDRLATLLGSLGIALGLASVGASWWTTAAVVALGLQLRMAVTGDRGRGPVVQQRLAALVALVLLAAA
jgi:4-hydroxybenzoate polyprenyltransferase